MMDIDLNLLRIFDILCDERNVTRAAARLFLTQSAVSHALARLREVLGDPLFMRIPSGLQPTARAHQLAPRLRVALAEIRSAVATPMFDPAKARQRFVIAASPYFCMLIVPSLIALARKSAPGITLQIVNISADVAQALDQQQVDLALGAFDKVPPRLRSEVLFHDEKAWAIGTHHPLAKQPFDHAAFLAGPRLAIGLARAADKSREPPSRNDLVFRVILETDHEADSPRSAHRTSTSMMVYDAQTAMAVAAATDMVALVPRRYAEACPSSGQIRIIDFPRDHAEMIELSMLWHSRVHGDPGSLWLRVLIREAVKLSSDTLRPRGSVNRRSASASAGKKAKKVPTPTRRAKGSLT
ncbi:LysR family transcriptional regulator [Bradyrhizobium sp. Ash2021]|uniref:LysR family transcriptional regulator n=1 Tax=Bradyrhizobium sp. Ash2021 TaxID=2954771 RepID=UPI0028164D5F|nr:LysR family transcriptional regulator [Bradyrhizobium sp. Ash2021]WMT73909.1 LysR family transcriptional regulator [Bradyrhizobium sp. Ash2021]